MKPATPKGSSGSTPSSAGAIPDGTILDALVINAIHSPGGVAMRYMDDRRGAWESITWSDYLQTTRHFAYGLTQLGVDRGSRVAILSANRPEWHIADLATMVNGGISVPIYPTSSTGQVEYCLRNAHVRVCIVDDHDQLAKVLDCRDRLSDLKYIVVMRRSGSIEGAAVLGFDDVLAWGSEAYSTAPEEFDERVRAVRLEDLATIVYTSGTTGPPKAAMISHRNIVWTITQVADEYKLGEGERVLSFMPLSHIAERMVSHFGAVAIRAETWFARSLTSVGEDLLTCRPTLFLTTPRVWEKIRESIDERLLQQPFPIRFAFGVFRSLGLRVRGAEHGRRSTAVHLMIWSALDRSLGERIRRRIGLDQARIVVSTAAPAHPDLLRWFHAIGLPILELYGQTEACGPITANPLGAVRIGTVGKPLPGMSVRLAEDGEILLKGGNVFAGYLDNPAETAARIDKEGWLHTADTGTFDSAGYLRIVGRKNDLIITSSGKNIAPEPIESDLRSHPLIAEAVVVGDRRHFLVALLTLDARELSRWAERHHRANQRATLSTDPDLVREIQKWIDQVNALRSRAEWIRKFQILPHDLSGAVGELTPTMKVNRQVVYEHYASAIEALYASTSSASNVT